MLRILAVSAALVATVAAAQAPSDTPDSKGKEDANEVVCIRQPTTGSRVNNVRVCKTRAQWAQERAENRSDLQQIQGRTPTSGN